MRSTWSVMIVVALTPISCQATKTAPPVTLTTAAPVVGATSTEIEDVETLMKAESSPGQVMELSSKSHHDHLTEVLAVAGGIVTKVKITYRAHDDLQVNRGVTKSRPSPTAGKTYLAWRDPTDHLMVTSGDGSVVADDELAIVRKDEKNLARPEVLPTILARHQWTPGATVALAADELTELNALRPDPAEPKVAQMVFALTASDATTATFKLSMAMTITAPPNALTIELNGVAKIDRRTSQPLEISGTGPISGSLGAPVTGTMTTHTVYTY
jgi:hypothetical protein